MNLWETIDGRKTITSAVITIIGVLGALFTLPPEKIADLTGIINELNVIVETIIGVGIVGMIIGFGHKVIKLFR